MEIHLEKQSRVLHILYFNIVVNPRNNWGLIAELSAKKSKYIYIRYPPQWVENDDQGKTG
jgi:hypothetical protein